MSDFFKNRRKATLALGAFFLAVTLLAGSLAYVANGALDFATILPQSTPSAEKVELESEAEQEGEALEEDPRGEDDEEQVSHVSMPSDVRGVFLSPGTDFITGSDTSEATLRAEIDQALANAVELTMNTAIINTNYQDKVIYQTSGAPEVSSGFDILAYAVERARGLGLYTMVIFDMEHYHQRQVPSTLMIGGGTISTLSSNLKEFVEKYPVDSILLDGYVYGAGEDSYSQYSLLGGGIGFGNFLRQNPASLVKTASDTIRGNAGEIQVGLLADAVWANSEEEEEGSNTTASYTALGSGNADTKGFVEQGLVDFVAVKAYTTLSDSAAPFEEVAKWWAGVARQNDVPLYIVHAADKLSSGESGWSSSDQLAKQVIALEGLSGVRGSMFNNLGTLVADPDSASATLMAYYNQEVTAELILTELEMTKPESTSYTTTETSVTFAGASDPTSPVTINGESVQTDSSGYFSVTKELKGGTNQFTIVHKEKTISYSITRQVEILKDISPTGAITTEGGMSITISAWAYQDATVSANVNGSAVSMKVDESVVDESNRDSSYKYFVGQYTAPAAGSSEQNLGNITVSASWNGETKSMTGASIKVNKKAQIEDGVPVAVVADQAKTYPGNTLDNIPSPNCYPLPKGAMDYAVGDEIVYKKDSKTYTYTLLASGLRVESKDIQAISNDYPAQNVVSGMDVTTKGGYTYVTLKTAQKVSYSFSYASTGVSIQLHNTVQVPTDKTLSSNPIFSGATWSGGSKLTLSFVQNGGFMGYKGYYDDSGNLVFRFNNPPSSLSGARIAIDPGHGGSDPGTLGFLGSHPEKVVNLAIAQKLADELESRGAAVLLLDTSGGMELTERVARAESFEADLFVSIHSNSSTRDSAQGTETYYFYPYGKTLATSAAKSVSSQLGTENRGAKASYYHVTLSSQVPSVLIECGFMSNQAEYEKLISEKYQTAIAVGVADSLSATIKSTYTGSSASGTDTVGDAAATADSGQTSTDTATGGDKAQDVDVDPSAVTLSVGRSRTLGATVAPSTATNKNVTWSSGNTSVATVDSSGKVTAVKEGTAKITVSTVDGGHTAVCTVTVTAATDSDQDVPVEAVSLDEDTISLDVGESYNAKVKVYPTDATDDSVTFKSSDPSVATVSDSGKITGVKAGRATVTVTTKDGGHEYACSVTVTSDTHEDSGTASVKSGLSISKAGYYDFASGSVTLYINSGKQLEIYSEDDEVVDPTDFLWRSDDNNVVKVDQYGAVSSKGTTGTATITAVPKEDGYDSISCDVTVSKTKVAVTAITFNKSKLTVLQGQVNKELVATLSPSNASVTDITWKSSNDKIATVDQNGNITGKNRGTTIITATTKDGKKKAACSVEVLRSADYIDGVELDVDTLELGVGDEDILYATIYPENAGNTAVTWSSSNAKVVTVDKEGNIVAVAKGTARIRATSTADSNYYAECTITVL